MLHMFYIHTLTGYNLRLIHINSERIILKLLVYLSCNVPLNYITYIMLINVRHLLLINSAFDIAKPTLIEEIVSLLSDIRN